MIIALIEIVAMGSWWMITPPDPEKLPLQPTIGLFQQLNPYN